MLKGSQIATLVRLQPISIHGQVSYDAVYTLDDDPDQKHVARVGPEAIGAGVEPGDRVKLDFLVGVVTSITRAAG